MQPNSAYSAYNSINMSVDSQEKLVTMLYEGILRFVSRAKKAMSEKNVKDKVLYINKTTAIFLELRASLDLSQGDVALYLNGLYTREISRLMEANIKNDPSMLDEVINVTRELIAAWNDATAKGVSGAQIDEISAQAPSAGNAGNSTPNAVNG